MKKSVPLDSTPSSPTKGGPLKNSTPLKDYTHDLVEELSKLEGGDFIAESDTIQVETPYKLNSVGGLRAAGTPMKSALKKSPTGSSTRNVRIQE